MMTDYRTTLRYRLGMFLGTIAARIAGCTLVCGDAEESHG